ncbi:MAG: DVU0298 family protein [Bacillota bacterium]
MTVLSKEKVITLLEERKIDELADMIAKKRSAMRYLNRLLYDRDNILSWLAIEALGAVADRIAGEDPEAVRVILRNLLWSVNDESGGIGWGAPQGIGEIVYCRPDLFGEFASVILSYADEEMIRRGVLWAAGRIAQADPGLVKDDAKKLAEYLNDPDPVVRGYTVRFLDIAGEIPDIDRDSRLLQDRGTVPVYENGRLIEVTVAELASRWLEKYKKRL